MCAGGIQLNMADILPVLCWGDPFIGYDASSYTSWNFEQVWRRDVFCCTVCGRLSIMMRWLWCWILGAMGEVEHPFWI